MKLLGKGQDPKFWSEEVRNKEVYRPLIEKYTKAWETNYENHPIPAMTYSKFRMFETTGNRYIYEQEYFNKRCGLCTATLLSLVYPEEEKYITYLQDLVFAILNEFTWALPAHQPNLLSNTESDLIDLFACETGSALAEIYTLLGDRLDPVIRNRILLETERRIIRPFIDKPNYPWWRGTYTGNWAGVCIGSIGMMTMLIHPEYFDEMKPEFDRIIGNFLSGFSRNGICQEGTHYWGYGFGFFTSYAAMLREFTNGKDDYFKRDIVKKIATYIQKVLISGRSAVSFGDAPRTAEYYYGMVHFLKNEYPDDVKVYSPEYGTYTDGCGRFNFFTRGVIWMDENIYFNPTKDNEAVEYYDPDFQWYIKRTNNFSFAAKAGHNEEHHNHMDVGTFIFARGGKQLCMDLGSGVYRKDYSIGKETEVSGYYHNIPQIGEESQVRGKNYCAKDVSCENGAFTMDIAGAYNIPELKKLTRSFTVDEDGLTINDSYEYEGKEAITERFILSSSATIDNNKIITSDGMTIEFDPTVCTPYIYEKTLSREPFYVLEFTLKEKTEYFSIKIY